MVEKLISPDLLLYYFSKVDIEFVKSYIRIAPKTLIMVFSLVQIN